MNQFDVVECYYCKERSVGWSMIKVEVEGVYVVCCLKCAREIKNEKGK